MEISLMEQGCKVTTFKSAEDCLRAVEGYNLKNYDCLITDYSMPGMSGLDLLEEIKQIDSTLEVILVTGENERGIIQESLRKGAFDFLDKPLNLEKFYHSVEKAVTATSQRRKRDATEASLLAARSSGLFNTTNTENWSTNIDLIYTPKHELGGDFIDVFETRDQQHCAVFGDISGHDIQSALLSSHFLGNLAGRRSLQKRLDVTALLSDYNALLIERGENLGNTQHVRVGSSLSLCVIELSKEETHMRVTNCGLPALYLIEKTGSVHRMEPQYHPMGWFEDYNPQSKEFEVGQFSVVYGFTDGLVEYAHSHHLDVLSLIQHLRTLNKSDIQRFLINAEDDILLASFEFDATETDSIPIIFDEYPGDAFGKVDRYQKIWQNSIQLVAPDADPVKIDRFSLACREAVLNALKHGCQSQRKKHASFQINWNPIQKELVAVVSDPGEGHDFDFETRNQQLSDFQPGHLGLVLISKLVDELQLENQGACLRFKMKV